MSNNFNLMSEIMELKEKYTELVIPLIAFKYDYPQYAKQIEKALPILVDEEIIAAIDADLNTLEAD